MISTTQPTLFELIEKVNVEAAENAHAETPDALHPEKVLPEGHLECKDGAEKGPDDEGGGKVGVVLVDAVEEERLNEDAGDGAVANQVRQFLVKRRSAHQLIKSLNLYPIYLWLEDRHRISVLLHPKLGPKLLLRLCLLPRLLVGSIGVCVDIAEGQPDNADYNGEEDDPLDGVVEQWLVRVLGCRHCRLVGVIRLALERFEECLLQECLVQVLVFQLILAD